MNPITTKIIVTTTDGRVSEHQYTHASATEAEQEIDELFLRILASDDAKALMLMHPQTIYTFDKIVSIIRVDNADVEA